MTRPMHITRVFADRHCLVILCNRGLRQTYALPSKPAADFAADALRVALKQPRNGRN